MIHVEIYGGTDRGLQRDHNEDAIRHAQFAEGDISLALVADGVGGHAGGEIASHLAADTIEDHVSAAISRAENAGGFPQHWLQQSLANAIEHANREIVLMQQQDPVMASMATTIVSVLIQQDRLALGYLGDSRCYLWRNSKMQQLSRDQTLAQQMLDQGVITKQQYRLSPYHHVLSRALGLTETAMVDIELFEISTDDVFVLCSDGLTNCLSDSAIARILKQGNDIKDVTEELIACANDAGGVDNISVVLLKCREHSGD